jgi:intein/homing endonuclease
VTEDTELAYVAGFIDGEGCFRINTNGSIELTIINTSKSSLDFVLKVLRFGRVAERKQRVNKAQYQYRVYGPKCLEIVNRLLPYLIEKKPQAELIIEYKRNYKPSRKKGEGKSELQLSFIKRISDMKWVSADNEV